MWRLVWVMIGATIGIFVGGLLAAGKDDGDRRR